MRLLWGFAADMAMRAERRMSAEELRQWGDEVTSQDLNDYELDKLVRLIREHPAYQALPELPEDPPPEAEAYD